MHFALDFKFAKLTLSHVRILPLSREAEGDDIVVKIFKEAVKVVQTLNLPRATVVLEEFVR